MNILILSWRGPGHPNAGGAEQATFEHTKAWVKAGHNVTLFTSAFKDSRPTETLFGVRIIRQGRQVFGVHLKAFLWYFYGNHKKFDLVVDEFHGIPFFTPLYACLPARLPTGKSGRSAKKLALIHEVAGEVWKHNPWPKPFNLIPSILGSAFEPWVFKIFYSKVPFMTVSESTRDDLVAYGIPKKDITVIENGVTIKKPKKIFPKEKKPTALYLGAISVDKGTFDAVRAFGEINKLDKSWQFWIAGLGTKELLRELRKLARELDITDQLTFWGFVSDEKKYELFARAHVLVNPSYHEGWGLVNIEANYFGTPVVGYKVHGMVDSVVQENTGMLVDKGNFRELAETTVSLEKDDERYKRFQESCKKWASSFSWEKATKNSLKLLANL